jgi:mannose-6-phosphate isomerase-like protein (cupin superfamily)
VILSGAGQLKLDDEIFAVRARDAVRVAPDVARASEAARDGVEFLAVGPHHAGDGEPVDDSWVH